MNVTDINDIIAAHPQYKYVFIQYNPDSYEINNIMVDPDKNIRFKKLSDEINKHIERIKNNENKELLEIYYLFYDENTAFKTTDDKDESINILLEEIQKIKKIQKEKPEKNHKIIDDIDKNKIVIPQQSGLLAPSQVIPQQSRLLAPSQVIPQQSRLLAPSQVIPQQNGLLVPSQVIPQQNGLLVPSQVIPQQSRLLAPSQVIPQQSRLLAPSQVIPSRAGY